MKIEVNEHGTIVLKEVFNPIKLQTKDGETLIITMRDSGYEVCYENEFYELKQGKVSKCRMSTDFNQFKKLMEDYGYTVNEIERLEQNSIPENNTLEIVRGATGNY